MTVQNEDNICLLTDSYKLSHWMQYPPRSLFVSSFLESRGGEFDEVTFFGLQYYLKKYLQGPVVTQDKIEEAAEVSALHFGNDKIFNRAGWEYILNQHGGRLPISIRAVAEGTNVPVKNVLLEIRNTDPNVNWLTNHPEGLLSMLWYPTTVATQSRYMVSTIKKYLEETGDPSLLAFKLHDFGFRGSTSVESSGIGGAAHLINSMGTDTLQALRVLRKYYNERMSGFSIPAAEHSTITSWGRENESGAFKNMLKQFPSGLVAVVSDSYDIFHAVFNIWGKELKDQVIARDGVLIVRPDSGVPEVVVVEVLNLLGQAFGYHINNKGYKVLHDKVRVIQGDGIKRSTLPTILEAMKNSGWSADNLAFGSGGGLLQDVNRDTCKFAIKCSAIEIDGVWHDVYKDPVTDPGKKSKKGLLKLIKENGIFRTVGINEAGVDLLIPVFKNGEILVDHTFESIRHRANA